MISFPRAPLTPRHVSLAEVNFPAKRRICGAAAAVGLAVALPAGLAVAVPAASATQPSLGRLGSELHATQARSASLAASLSGLRSQIASLNRQITLVGQREAGVRAALAADQARLALAQAAVVRERARAQRLRRQLTRARALLARQLVSSYENAKPDLITVVLDAHGFAQLLEQLGFLGRAEDQQRAIVTVTRAAKARAEAATVRLGRLEAHDAQVTTATAIQARALAGMNALLQSRQAALSHVRAAQAAALAAVRARGARLRTAIGRIRAEQAAAARAAAMAATNGQSLGPSSGWAIPYPIVLCESGGQNLPPNSAGASGYYQIIPATWRQFGGTGPAAYLASKAEQDAVAARIWDGGAGASNWACAGILGMH